MEHAQDTSRPLSTDGAWLLRGAWHRSHRLDTGYKSRRVPGSAPMASTQATSRGGARHRVRSVAKPWELNGPRALRKAAPIATEGGQGVGDKLEVLVLDPPQLG